MSEIAGAKCSPRIELGVLKWYAGDEFTFNLTINLKDQDGLPVDVKTADTVKVLFLDARKNHTYLFEFSGVKNNHVSLVFGPNVTKLFKKGEYTYSVILIHDGEKTTLSRDCAVMVE